VTPSVILLQAATWVTYVGVNDQISIENSKISEKECFHQRNLYMNFDPKAIKGFRSLTRKTDARRARWHPFTWLPMSQHRGSRRV